MKNTLTVDHAKIEYNLKASTETKQTKSAGVWCLCDKGNSKGFNV
jgi:hypothetical protein